MRLGMVVTDLDGTLLNSQHALSVNDRRALVELGERGVVRVIATGRSLFSAKRVLPADLPIDYLVHTSGAGIMRWPEQRSLRALAMRADLAHDLAAFLVSQRCDFMLHHAIPNNHCFYAHRSSTHNPDFEHRVQVYAEFASELAWPRTLAAMMCQVVIIEPPGPSRHEELRAALPQFHVVRTTSPFDGASTWTEVFPADVSKSNGAAWIRARDPGLAQAARCIAIGNDYNDMDLLLWADRAYVVANAPADLRARFTTVASNNASGFSEAVQRASADDV